MSAQRFTHELFRDNSNKVFLGRETQNRVTGVEKLPFILPLCSIDRERVFFPLKSSLLDQYAQKPSKHAGKSTIFLEDILSTCCNVYSTPANNT